MRKEIKVVNFICDRSYGHLSYEDVNNMESKKIYQRNLEVFRVALKTSRKIYGHKTPIYCDEFNKNDFSNLFPEFIIYSFLEKMVDGIVKSLILISFSDSQQDAYESINLKLFDHYAY